MRTVILITWCSRWESGSHNKAEGRSIECFLLNLNLFRWSGKLNLLPIISVIRNKMLRRFNSQVQLWGSKKKLDTVCPMTTSLFFEWGSATYHGERNNYDKNRVWSQELSESHLSSNVMMLYLPRCSLNWIMALNGKLVLTSMLPIISVIQSKVWRWSLIAL